MGDSTSLTFRLFGVDVSAGKVLKEVGEHAKSTGSKIHEEFGSKVAAAAALAGGGLAIMAKEAVDSASELGETTSKVGVLFGAQADAVSKFADTAAAKFGQSKQEALDAAADFATFGKGAGLTGNDLVKFSTNLDGLASDMASFSNTSPQEAIEAIGAALRGESEPIRKYGVLLDAASVQAKAVSMGLVKSKVDTQKLNAEQVRITVTQAAYNKAVKEHGANSIEAKKAQVGLTTAQAALKKTMEGTTPQLTQQQKVLATQALIMDQTKAAQGDFARTSGGLANQQRIMKAEFANASAELGASLLPIMTQLAHFATGTLVPILNTVVGVFKDYSGVIIPVVVGIGGLVAAFGAVEKVMGAAKVATQLWSVAGTAASVVSKAWAGVQWLLNAAMEANPIGLVVVAIAALVAALVIAYNKSETFRNIVQAVMHGVVAAFGWIVDAGKAAWNWLWTNVFTKLISAAQEVGGWFLKLYTTYVKVAWAGIQLAIAVVLAWIRTEWAILSTAIRVLGAVFTSLWHDYVTPAWNGIKTAISAVWNWVRDNVFNPFKAGLSALGTAFETAKNAISTAWNKVKEAAAAPVRFVVNTVFGGIIGKFNDIVSKVGVPTLPVPHVAFALGGEVPARFGKRGVDSVPALLMPDEHVWTAAEVKAAGGHGVVEQLRALAASGRIGLSGDTGMMVVRRFADGGAVDKVMAVRNWLPSLTSHPYVWGAVGPGGYDCSGLVGEVWARLTGNPSYRRYMTTTSILANPGGYGFAPGPGLFTIGVSNEHTDGNLAGLGFEAPHTGVNIRVGGSAQPTSNFPHQFHLAAFGGGGGGGGFSLNPVDWAKSLAKDAVNSLVNPLFNKLSSMSGVVGQMAIGLGKHIISSIFDSGGLLMPGTTLVHNRTGAPEAVLTGQQWDNVRSIVSIASGRPRALRGFSAGGFGSGPEVHLHVSGFVLGTEQQFVKQMKQALASVQGTGLRFAGA